MKKQTVVMIVVLALLLIVAGCFGIYYVGYKNDKKTENTELFSCMPSEIVEYSVNDGETAYKLVKKDDMWSVADNSVAVLDQKKVQDVVNSASRIVYLGVLKKRDIKGFEVIDIQSLDLKLKDGTEVNFKFVGVKDGICAVRMNDSEEIYSVRKSVWDILVAKLDNFRVALVFEELKNIDEKISYYSFTDYDKTKTVVRTKTAAEISASKSNRYMMDAPYKKQVDDEKFEQQIAVKISQIAAAQYVDDFPENLEDYGLDEESRAVLHFRWGDAEETLYLGTDLGGKVHAIKNGQDGVFVINSSQLEFLQTEPFYILESGILKSDTENIYKVAVRTKDETFDITSSGRNGNNGQFFVNGKVASEAAFSTALEKLSDVKIFSELATVPEDTRDIVIDVYFDNHTGVQTISLAAVGDKEYAAFINGKAEFAVKRETVEALIEELEDISKNPMKIDEKG